MGFSRQEYWSVLPHPSPGNLPNPGIEPPISCIAGGFFNLWATGEALTGVKASIKGCYIQKHVEKHSVGTKWIGQFDRRRQWHPTLVLLPGKFHGWRSLVGCSTWGHRESNMTEWLHFHFSLSCIGEENGNPVQCSCLENPRTGEPGGLPSMESHRVGHDWSDFASAAAAASLRGSGEEILEI